ncbi:acyl-CoA dehydrogenase family protein [Methylocapsa sp. S129]|uniref:acyl-CoA dehydrogenase family protein n=1 Tax=Methylocapsa sp. S129 TaxID=1641869 RepID=UPI001FEEBF51|nr:acyl-CoA dehydrogenase family protein [Methylocapsa sp. S129]
MRDDPVFVMEAAPNQSPPFAGRNLFLEDRALQDGANAAGVDAGREALAEFGAACGSAEAMEFGRLANEFSPRLRLVDSRGNRLDQIEFHPAYHALMARDMAVGLHGSIWDHARAPRMAASGQAARAARLFMATQAESGHICPLTMTSASVAALRRAPELAEKWLPKILGRVYDPALKPWWEKSAVTLGMGMTEPQGGTDVRANTTRAEPVAGGYEITGAKWFMSAPMCDAFLVLAQAPGGLTTFLTPRFRPDGGKNEIFFQRLKDKLGNRSNASSEVVFSSAFAERVGPEGEGVRTIIEMVQMTRLDCVVASAGLMRFALAQATYHVRHRRAFQKFLIDQPLMRAVLADLALEVEGATALAFRLARAFDRAAADPDEAAYARLITPAAKFLVCKAAPHFVYEAMECLGGNGYVEEWPMARAYREAPLNAIWEGPGNVMALDVLRAAARAPDAAKDVVARLNAACDLPPETLSLEADLVAGAERLARRTCERLARLAAAAALAERQPSLAEAYVATRLTGEAYAQYGGADLVGAEHALLDRILPPED